MKKHNKIFLFIALTLMLVLAFSSLALASDDDLFGTDPEDTMSVSIEPTSNPSESQIAPMAGPVYVWEIASTSYVGTSLNGSTKQPIGSYWGVVAGERWPVSVSTAYSGTISGTINVRTSVINAALGFSYSTSVSLSATSSSPPLNVGQKVDAFWQKNYAKYKVVQQQYLLLPGGGKSAYGSPVTCYVFKPVLPYISFKLY